MIQPGIGEGGDQVSKVHRHLARRDEPLDGNFERSDGVVGHEILRFLAGDEGQRGGSQTEKITARGKRLREVERG